ncbi:MAG: tRNA guanosine(34) transglycosylase Tgt [Alphaproteobacteria bacterium]|nr:MAG: tRNA guanosine(34) transglycosylase Tgt [Alphaproteobacteria bacterium]
MAGFSYSVYNTDGAARRGTMHTVRGDIQTPAFMPVGTAATVKAMMPANVADTGAEIILGNTYHLMLRPGPERIAGLGGLHKFMNWDKPILTDSGGFQVMSLSKLRTMTEEGVAFQSHLDGNKFMLTPERSMEIQRLLGSNIVMTFDECTPYPVEKDAAAESMQLSMRWAQRSRDGFDTGGQHAEDNALFGIVQGSTYEDLRAESSAKLIDIGFEGYAIGGLAVGEGQDMMFEVLDYTVPFLPDDRPRYLMGVGKPADLVGAVMRGVDMFDCVLPTRSGRNGQAFTRRGAINIKNARHVDDPRPLDDACSCPACTQYSRAYLSHVVRSNEIIGSMLMSWHNLQYYQDLMADMRAAIEAGKLIHFASEFSAQQAAGDIEPV